MKQLLEKLSRAIGFTPNEGKIVFFLIGAFLIGGALKLVGVSPSHNVHIDYSTSDSVFAQKSQLLGQVVTTQDSTDDSTPEENDNGTGYPQKETPTVSYPIDINTATRDVFMTLPGVGVATAERILLYREEHGRFTSLDQLLNIKGIGEKKLDQLKPYLKLEK